MRGVPGIVAAALLAAPLAAVAALPPSVSSGAAQSQSRQERQRLEREQSHSRLHGPVLVGPHRRHQHVAKGGPRFTLKRIAFSRSRFLAPQRLQALAKPYLHHPIHVAALYRLVAKVNGLYAQRGLVTDRAILPPQRIRHGVVHIRLVEGRVGAFRIRGLSYTDRSFVTSRVPVTGDGQVLDSAALERELIWFDRTNDVALKASLRPGSRFGLTNVLLQAVEPPRYRLDLLVNNEGERSTGRLQGGIYGLIYGPLGHGDRLSLYAVKSRGAFNGNFGYQIPLTARGLKLSLSAAHNDIHIIDGPYQKLDIRGHADVGQLGLTRPLVASRRWLVTAAASTSYTEDRTDVGGVPLSRNYIWTPGAGMTVQYDRPGQSYLLTQTVERGFAREALGQNQVYWMLPGSFSARLQVGGPVFATVSGGWQYSRAGNLPPSQLFQIGGADTVPGYPVGAASGVKGYYGHGSMHLRIARNASLGLGYSNGAVYATYPSHTSLQSVDVGLRGRLPRMGRLGRVSWHFSLAHPMTTVVPDETHWIAYFSVVAPILF